MSVIFSTALAASSSPPAFLLPDGIVPTKYTIDLTIDPSKDSFSGRARIEVDVQHPTNIIWLNARNIAPLSAHVDGKTALVTVAGGEFMSLEPSSPIGAGLVTLDIRYRGKLDDKSVVGPYRRKVGVDWYVFTTFTPIDAREAFPCFDEPRFKTPWQLTIHTPRTNKAFSNARAYQETAERNGMKAVRFAGTKPLPTEVVAFAVGPFDVYRGGNASDGTPIRVIAPRGFGAEGKAAAQATMRVLPRLEAYTGIPYPYGKLDHVALPEGAFGAVENPGMITYLQRALLTTAAQDTAEKEHAIRALEAHEISHQWFGDMVTQATWDDVWLSEGFATWLSQKIMDEEEPAARKRLRAVSSRQDIMQADSLSETRPVRLTMHSRKDTQNVYSEFVYQKGAAVLLMLEGWLGEDIVQSGLRAYLKDHAFGNASTADLEGELRTAAHVDPAPMMDAFLNQTGIPKIHAELKCSAGAGPSIMVEQTDTTRTWPVPVCWRTADGTKGCTVVDSSRVVDLPSGEACPAWVYWNSGATGYYRTQWTADQLKRLDLGQLTGAERLTLVYDLADLKTQPDVLAMLSKLAVDREPEIARAAKEVLK